MWAQFAGASRQAEAGDDSPEERAKRRLATTAQRSGGRATGTLSILGIDSPDPNVTPTEFRKVDRTTLVRESRHW